MDELVDCIVQELKLSSETGREGTLGSLYLGGGTPSLLTPKHLDKILTAAHQYFPFRKDPEITMECNPDDLNRETLRSLHLGGINRLSIGVQSFQQRDLELMRRSHTIEQASQAIVEAAEEGFDNITIDLIYGIPGQTSKEWELNLKQAFSLPVTHLSAYHLTFEPGTVFDHWRKKGKITEVTEELSITQYSLLRQLTGAEGFEHYEISNFARDERYSAHNLLYWSGESYLGVGPSAHSYHGTRRSWNVASLKKYMESLQQGNPFRESETLTVTEQYHDVLITKLRTRWGVDPLFLEARFGTKYRQWFDQKATTFISRGVMHRMGKMVAIHPDQWFISDHIFRELFIDPGYKTFH
jgi:oxygen-independent coproporphyrinogen-3 oxidase